MARVWPFGLVLGVSNNVSVRMLVVEPHCGATPRLGLENFYLFFYFFIFRFKGL